jgi:DNA/RNA endonuclease YhcR with UshA esterase domain
LETSARIAGRGAWTKQPVRPPDTRSQALTAADTSRLRDLAGESVTVRGTISRIGWLKDYSITFLNFDGNARGDFVCIIRKEDLSKISASLPGKNLTSLIGQPIQVSGPITLHRSTPQIELASPDQIKLLPAP